MSMQYVCEKVWSIKGRDEEDRWGEVNVQIKITQHCMLTKVHLYTKLETKKNHFACAATIFFFFQIRMLSHSQCAPLRWLSTGKLS
jgi:hypothetical protein